MPAGGPRSFGHKRRQPSPPGCPPSLARLLLAALRSGGLQAPGIPAGAALRYAGGQQSGVSKLPPQQHRNSTARNSNRSTEALAKTRRAAEQGIGGFLTPAKCRCTRRITFGTLPKVCRQEASLLCPDEASVQRLACRSVDSPAGPEDGPPSRLPLSYRSAPWETPGPHRRRFPHPMRGSGRLDVRLRRGSAARRVTPHAVGNLRSHRPSSSPAGRSSSGAARWPHRRSHQRNGHSQRADGGRTGNCPGNLE